MTAITAPARPIAARDSLLRFAMRVDATCAATGLLVAMAPTRCRRVVRTLRSRSARQSACVAPCWPLSCYGLAGVRACAARRP